MKTDATEPSANAMGMPENKTVIVAKPNSNPICSVVILEGARLRWVSREPLGESQ